jgi:hypothetical protein
MLLAALFFATVIVLEVPRMLKNGLYRELKVFAVLMLLAMAGAYAAILDLPLPNLAEGLDAVFRPAFMALEGLLAAPE